MVMHVLIVFGLSVVTDAINDNSIQLCIHKGVNVDLVAVVDTVVRNCCCRCRNSFVMKPYRLNSSLRMRSNRFTLV